MCESGCFKIESFSCLDGEGVRLVVFLDLCPYRCLYCHNPEGWSESKKKVSVEGVIKLYEKNIEFYSNGGITLSGGEPLMHKEFCLEMAEQCFLKKISLAIDTCGYICEKRFIEKLAGYKVHFLVDIKHTIPKYHRLITGKEGVNELKLIKLLEKCKSLYTIRFVYAKGLTDQKKNLERIKKIIEKTKYMKEFAILPLHLLAKKKYEEVGYKYKVDESNVPSNEEVEKLKEYFKIMNK
ncbi:MAG: radical SAM protein [Mycoplasmataceae bacterium]|jgi:pyruvate formate lyase activating enzyme|nr:radical SAM protein [Mycoplasmataceae bacterium]